MNLYLHGVEPHIYLGDTIYEPDRGERYDVVLTNPPFGTRGANQAPDRDDFTIETSNKQLNFVQHVMNILKPGGGAAIVLPDNCLFEDKAELAINKCRVKDQLRLGIGDLGLAPRFDLVLHRLEIPLDSVHTYRERIDQVEAFGVLGQHRREHATNGQGDGLRATGSYSTPQVGFWEVVFRTMRPELRPDGTRKRR